LREGRVRPEGINLTYIQTIALDVFFRMLKHAEFDAAEMSLSSYVLGLKQGDDRFVAIPAFLSRTFRHNAIYINENAGVREPADLVGKRVGIPEYQVTAAVWIRGILAEHYGVPVDSVMYHTGGLEEPGRYEKVEFETPPGVVVKPIPGDRTLNEMLLTGEVAAVYAPRPPLCFNAKEPGIRRLFPDPRSEEEEYFRRTGIFPIMHMVVIRRDVYERRRWVARSLLDALDESRAQAQRRLNQMGAPACMLPWLYEELERTHAVMGPDFWSYGFEENRTTLETFLRYAAEQGLADPAQTAEGLFAPETLERARV
jgi:4,5-dihydroxyphthalate decarboxylase